MGGAEEGDFAVTRDVASRHPRRVCVSTLPDTKLRDAMGVSCEPPAGPHPRGDRGAHGRFI